MIVDADLQVWLDTQVFAGQTVVVPYVLSVSERQLTYRLEVRQASGAGTSRISQNGRVNANAASPTALSKVALQNAHGCQVEVVLTEGVQQLGTYRFDCKP